MKKIFYKAYFWKGEGWIGETDWAGYKRDFAEKDIVLWEERLFDVKEEGTKSCQKNM